MTGVHEAGDFFPGHLMETAEAITSRSLQNNAVEMRLMASITGAEFVSHENSQNAQLIGQTALNLLRVENPSRIITIHDAINSVGDTFYDSLAQRIRESRPDAEIEVTPDILKNMQIALSEEVSRTFDTDELNAAKDFADQYNAAKAVAAENDTSIAAVYKDDALYYEMRRRTQTPEEFATKSGTTIRNMSTENTSAAVGRLMETLRPNDSQELTPEDTDAMIKEMRSDTEFMQELERAIEPVREATRQSITYTFLKTYGYDVLMRLDPQLRDGFIPRQPWVPEVFADFMGQN